MNDICRVLDISILRVYKIKMNIENLKNYILAENIEEDDINSCRHNY